MTLLEPARVCDHRHPPEPYWWVDGGHEAACQEGGWICGACSTRLGFRADLDRSHTETKVWCLLMDLHEAGYLYVSNGTQGDLITAAVVARCHFAGVYDQLSILQFLLSDPNLAGDGDTGHARYWHDEAQRWLREREADR